MHMVEDRASAPRKKNQQSSPASSDSLLDKIIALFTGGGDPDRDKKRLLKQITKDLKKQRYKFYKPRGEEVLPGLAKFVYNIYKVLGPAQLLLNNAENSSALKTIMIESYLNEKQRKIMEEFTEDSIREKAKTMEVKVLTSELKEQLVNFFSVFDSQKIKEINNMYRLFMIFLQLVNFDYYFFLKKFDSRLPERDLLYSPNFDTVNGEYIVEDLKDFTSVLPLLDQGEQWNELFDILKIYKGEQDVVSRADWGKLIKSLTAVRQSEILELMIKHIDKDPYYTVTIYPPQEKIVEIYLTKLKTQMELTVQKILQEKKSGQIKKLVSIIFGTVSVSRMKFYTETANANFAKKRLAGFIYIEPMNYLKAFLLDFVKKDLKEIVDTLLIRGKWTTNVTSNQLSDSFHSLLEISDGVLAFDESLSEEGEMGTKLKNMVHRSDRDANSQVVLKQQLKEVNEKALVLMRKSAQSLISVAKTLKMCIEDAGKTNHELIINWKELENATEYDLKERMTHVYKHIYFFVQLMQFYVK